MGVSLADADRERIEHGVRRAAYHIIEGKGATYYGIGSAIARIAEVILRDQRAILTICSPQSELLGVRDVTVSMPTLIGGAGVLDVLSQPLNAAEAEKLAASARVVKEAIEALK